MDNIDDIIKNVVDNQKEQQSAEELYKQMFQQIISCLDQQGKNIDYLKDKIDRLDKENDDVYYWLNKTIGNVKFLYKFALTVSIMYAIAGIVNLIINLVIK